MSKIKLYGIYDSKHTHPVNIALHMIAIPLGFSFFITMLLGHPWIGLLQIPAAFALAWIGHGIEGNVPAFMTNPTHVFVAPVWMYRKLTGRDRQAQQDVIRKGAA